ncbi:MAG: FtsX-like permease family protein, partial [Flavobacteriaceae bacterium]|nr:FtsX-like permease family protein [Flavobacteriaceae bacterium]
MFKNYFKIAIRTLWKNKLFSLINVISLAIGLSASFVIGLMVYYDLSFDKFHENGEEIYRVTSTFITPDGEFHNSGVALALKDELTNNFTGIEEVAAIHSENFLTVEIPETKKTIKKPENTAFVDPSYFEIFKYKWITGSPKDLAEPNKVVLTDKRAQKYFPNISTDKVIGQTLIYNDSIQVTVSGLVEHFQERSDLHFQEFLSVPTAKKTGQGNFILEPTWNSTSSGNQVFVTIPNNSDKIVIKNKLDELAQEHRSEFDVQFKQKREFNLQPLSDLHFNQELGTFNSGNSPANKNVMIGLGFVALFLLALGCINFINLNTAQASQRAKEIGIRKTLGSSKRQLVAQFLGETFLLTILAAVLSIVLAYWLLDVFSDFTPEGLDFSLFNDPVIISLAVALILLVTLFSGLYPAGVLTQFKPVSVIKNQVVDGSGKPILRKFLTVFQFSIAQVFLIATLLVTKQINFMMSEDMGFKTDAIASVNTPWHEKSYDKRKRFAEELKQLPSISKVALGGSPPASFSTSTNIVSVTIDGEEIQSPLQLIRGDQNFIDLYEIEILAGRKQLNDTIHEFVVNEAFINALGISDPEKALGLTINMNSEANPIVGVVKDFNQRSLKLPINPLAILGDWNRKDRSSFYTVHLNIPHQEGSRLSETIASVEDIYKSIYPNSDFEIQFMDETVGKFYKQEMSLSKLLNWAMGLSIVISCLGLLGLVIYTTERRTKEIGIRKVLGANIAQLNVLLCKDFLILVAISFVIAAPISYWFLRDWIQDFAFRTELSWWVFALSGLAMVVV